MNLNSFFQINETQEVSDKAWQEIVYLENQNFSDPWSLECLQANLKHPYFFFIYKNEEAVIAYAIFLLALDSVDLLNLSVSKKQQGTELSGVFLSQCLSYIIKSEQHPVFPDHQIQKCFLEVRVSNTRAIVFYQKHGFKKINIRKSYYEDNNEDAVVMLKVL